MVYMISTLPTATVGYKRGVEKVFQLCNISKSKQPSPTPSLWDFFALGITIKVQIMQQKNIRNLPAQRTAKQSSEVFKTSEDKKARCCGTLWHWIADKAYNYST